MLFWMFSPLLFLVLSALWINSNLFSASASSTLGFTGRSVSFDGSNTTCITLPPSTKVGSRGYGEFTVAAWFKFDDRGETYSAIARQVIPWKNENEETEDVGSTDSASR